MGFKIVTRECCGGFCASYEYYNERDQLVSVFAKEYASAEATLKWMKTEAHSIEEKISVWEGKLEALKKLLAKLVNIGKLTEEQAKVEMEKWLRENPNPDPEQELIDVTEEFMKIQKRVIVPAER